MAENSNDSGDFGDSSNSRNNTDIALSKFYEHIEDNNENQFACHHPLCITHNARNFHSKRSDCCNYSSIPISGTLPRIHNDNIVETKIIEDSLLKYIKEKNNWKSLVVRMKRSYHNLPKKRRIEEFNRTTSRARVPFYLIKFTNLLSQDPDPYFDSNYNWYYSGNGNLCCINYDDCIHFLKSAEDSCDIITLHNEQKSKHSCENKELIHETSYWNGNIVGLRQKKSIELLSLFKTQDNLKLSSLKSLNSKIPITSFNLESERRICYSCVDGSIHLCDIESNQQTLIAPPQNEIVPNRWSRLEQWDVNSYLYITDSSVCFKDKRNNNVREEFVPSNLKSCEKISAVKLTTDNANLLYIGTGHSFQILDVRYMNMERNFFVKHWSHGLKSPPLFISKSKMEEYDLFFLSNQYSNESSIILDGEQNILPWHPPTIHDTLKAVQKRGYCLDPTSSMKTRLLSSIIGHTFYNTNGLINSVRLNAYGDIVHQYIHNGICSDNESELCDTLTRWCEKLPVKTNFQATQLIDVSQAHKRASSYRKPRKIKEHSQRIYWKLCNRNKKWNCTLEKMSKCTDMFAHELLSFWELNPEEFDNNKDTSQMLSAPFDVGNWLIKSEY